MTDRIADLGGIETFSGVSANDLGSPFVTIRVLDDTGAAVAIGQGSPEDARTMALNLLAAAEAAESDAAVFDFLTTTIGIDTEQTATTIGGLRDHRGKWDNTR